MRKLGVTLLGITTLVLMVVFIGPAFVGITVQKDYTKLLKSYEANTPNIHLQLVSYKRRWFDSDATVKVTVAVTTPSSLLIPSAGPTLTSTIKQHINHGPIIVSEKNGQRKLILAKAIMRQSVLNPNWALASETTWRFNQVLDTKLHIDHGIVENKAFSAKADNVHGSISHDLNSHQLSGSMSFGHLAVTTQHANQKNKTVGFHNLAVAVDLKTDGALWYGNRGLGADSITIDDGEEKIELQKANMQTEATHDADNKTTDFLIQYQLNQILINHKPTASFKSGLAFKNLDTNALRDLKAKMNALEKEGALGAATIPALKEPFVELLKKGLVIEINGFEVNSKEGTVTADAKISLPAVKEETTTSDAHHPMFLATLFTRLDGSGDITIPKAWMRKTLVHHYTKLDKHHKKTGQPVSTQTPEERTAQSLHRLIGNKMFLETDNRLTLHWLLKKGRFTINGLPPNFELEEPSTQKPMPHKVSSPQQMMVPTPQKAPSLKSAPPHVLK